MNKNLFKNKKYIGVSKTYMLMLVAYLLYKFFLDMSYKNIIAYEYGYNGFEYTFSVYKFIESIIVSIIMFCITPKKKLSLSNVFLQIQLLVMIVPMIVIYTYNNYSRIYLYFIMFCHIIQVMALLKVRKKKSIKIAGAGKKIRIVLPVMLIFLIVISIKYNGMPSLSALNFMNVYSIRGNTVLPFGFGYFINWACKIIVPFGIIYYLNRKEYRFVCFYLIVQIVLYLIYAHKTFLFMMPMIIAVWLLLKMKGEKFIPWLYIGLNVVVVGCYLFYLMTDNLIPASLFIRRVLFVPAQLKNVYYNFYSVGPKNWFAYGFIGKIMLLFGIKPNYPYTTSTMIATYMHGEFWTGANTGYMGDAYAQGGFIMMILFSLLLVLIIRLIERNSDSLDNKIVIASSIYIFFTLNDGALLTTILTGGLWLYVVLVCSFNSDAAKMQNYRIKEINIK